MPATPAGVLLLRTHTVRHDLQCMCIWSKMWGLVWLQVVQSARQALTVCEQKDTDKVALEYDSRNPFDLCSVTFTPIYRGNQYAEDPYTKARFAIQAVGGIFKILDQGQQQEPTSGTCRCFAAAATAADVWLHAQLLGLSVLSLTCYA